MNITFTLILISSTVKCYSVGWKCVNECPGNFGEYKADVDDRYYGKTEESAYYKNNIYVKSSFFPIGKGKIVYGPEKPGLKRGFIN